MEVLTTSDGIEKKICSLIGKYQIISFASAWASANSKAFKVLMKNKNKINKIVVGIHFYQTNPNFIEEFLNNDKVKFITNPSGIFHPKIYMFLNNDNDWEALVGSANFTKAAFEKNTETMICISNKDINAEETYYKLIQEIENYHQRAKIFTKDDLISYTQIWNKKLKIRDDLQDKFGKNNDVKPIYKSKIIMENWQDYFLKVRNDKNNSFYMRLELLKTANQYFSNNTFHEMQEIERMKISGTVKDRDGINFHLFGNMGANPRFTQRIKDDYENISSSLEFIPLNGIVTKQNYMNCIEYFKKNKDEGLGYGVATISRLLSMKRPDTFFCLTGGNSTYLYKDFGIKKEIKRHEYERYWDEIIERIYKSDWFNIKEPSSLDEKKLWNNRVAMLDSIFYNGEL